MDEEIERLIVSVRADTAAFARDVAEMRGALGGPLEAGAELRSIEGVRVHHLQGAPSIGLQIHDLVDSAHGARA